jgi:hypothetical protein
MMAVLGLIAGNFIYQLLLDTPNYMVAAERSFFMVGAVAVYVALQKFGGRA